VIHIGPLGSTDCTQTASTTNGTTQSANASTSSGAGTALEEHIDAVTDVIDEALAIS